MDYYDDVIMIMSEMKWQSLLCR